MGWYSAHNIMKVQYIDPSSAPDDCIEMIILIYSNEDTDDLTDLARKSATRFNGSPLLIDGRPAILSYAGTRKIVSCSAVDWGTLSGPEPPSDGTEVSFSKYSVDSNDDFQALLMHNKPARVTYGNELPPD